MPEDLQDDPIPQYEIQELHIPATRVVQRRPELVSAIKQDVATKNAKQVNEKEGELLSDAGSVRPRKTIAASRTIAVHQIMNVAIGIFG